MTPNHSELSAAHRVGVEARFWRDEGIRLQIACVSKLGTLPVEEIMRYDFQQLLASVRATRAQAHMLEELQSSLKDLQDTIRTKICKDVGLVDLERLLASRDEAR